MSVTSKLETRQGDESLAGVGMLMELRGDLRTDIYIIIVIELLYHEFYLEEMFYQSLRDQELPLWADEFANQITQMLPSIRDQNFLVNLMHE